MTAALFHPSAFQSVCSPRDWTPLLLPQHQQVGYFWDHGFGPRRLIPHPVWLWTAGRGLNPPRRAPPPSSRVLRVAATLAAAVALASGDP